MPDPGEPASAPGSPESSAGLVHSIVASVSCGDYPGVRFSFEAGDIVSQVLNFGAPTPIQVSVSGKKLSETRRFAQRVLDAVSRIPELRDAHIPLALEYPTLRIQIDRERAGQLGLTVDRIGKSLVDATSVRSYPGVKFTGTVARIAESIDTRTRSMAVELDVDNTDRRLMPGMFAEVLWPVKRTTPSLFVPPGAIVQSTEKTFVARIRDGAVEQVPVQRGAVQGDLVEVFGGLQEGDTIARRGSEELRPGAHVEAHAAAPPSSSAK